MGIEDIYKKIDKAVGGYLPGGVTPQQAQSKPSYVINVGPTPAGYTKTTEGILVSTPGTPANAGVQSALIGGGGGGSSAPVPTTPSSGGGGGSSGGGRGYVPTGSQVPQEQAQANLQRAIEEQQRQQSLQQQQRTIEYVKAQQDRRFYPSGTMQDFVYKKQEAPINIKLQAQRFIKKGAELTTRIERGATKFLTPYAFQKQEVVRQASELIDKKNLELSKQVEDFNIRYGSRELPEEEYNKALKESQDIEQRNKELTKEYEKVSKIEPQLEQERRRVTPLPSYVLSKGAEGINSLFIYPISFVASGVGALSGDAIAGQRFSAFALAPFKGEMQTEDLSKKEVNATEKLNELKKNILDDKYLFGEIAEKGGMAFVSSAIGKLHSELNKPIITKVSFKGDETKFTASNLIQSIIKEGRQTEKGTFNLRAKTPERFVEVDTRLNKLKRSLGLKADKYQPIIMKVRNPEQRVTIGNVKTEMGKITAGITATRRAGKDVTLTKVGKLGGGSEQINIQDLTALTKSERELLDRGLIEFKSAVPKPSENIDFFRTGITSEEWFKSSRNKVSTSNLLKKEVSAGMLKAKLTKGSYIDELNIFAPARGKRTTRAGGLSMIKEVSAEELASEHLLTKPEGVDLFKSKTALKDITLSNLGRRGGKIDVIRESAVIREPIIIDSEIEHINIGRTKLVTKTGTKQALSIQEAVILQKARQSLKASEKATNVQVSNLRKIMGLKAEAERVSLLPVYVGGGGKGISKYAGQGGLIEIESIQPLSKQVQAPQDITKQNFNYLSGIRVTPIYKDLTKSFSLSGSSSINKELQKDLQKNLNKELQKDLQKNIQKEIQKPLEKNLQKDLQKELQKQLQKQIQKQIEKQIPKTPVRPIPRTPTKTPTTPFFFGFLPRERKERFNPNASYLVEERRFGKFKPIAKAPSIAKAFAIGQTQVKRTLGRTFRVTPLQKEIISSGYSLDREVFRRPVRGSRLLERSLTFVQRSRKSLASQEERRAIQESRRLRVQLNKPMAMRFR